MRSFIMFIALGLMTACGQGESADDTGGDNGGAAGQSASTVTAEFDFEEGPQGWTTNAIGHRSRQQLELEGEVRPLPEGTGSGSGFFLGSSVFSPSLLFYMRRNFGPEDGLQPNETYSVEVSTRFVTSLSQRCLGPGGSPGNANIVLTARDDEPSRERDESGEWRFDFDRSELADVSEIGHQGECDGEYRAIDADLSSRLSAQSGDDGRIWFMIGISPVALARHEVFFDHIEIRFTPQ